MCIRDSFRIGDDCWVTSFHRGDLHSEVRKCFVSSMMVNACASHCEEHGNRCAKNSVKHTAEFVVPRSIPTTFSARTFNAVTLALQAGAAFLQRRRVPANALDLDDLQQCCFVAWRCNMLLAGKVDIIVHVNRRSSDGAHRLFLEPSFRPAARGASQECIY